MARAAITLQVAPTVGARRQIAADLADVLRRVRLELVRSRERLRQTTEDLCPERSRYMRTHIRATPTADGLGYAVGWYREDFVGHRNRFGEAIRTFYPPFPEFGTRRMAPRPSLTPAAIQEFSVLPRRLAAAMG